MMSVTASPASLVQAVMGTDMAAAPEQPAANAAQFAALIAGLGIVPKTGEVETPSDTDTADAKDQTSDDLLADDGNAEQQPGEDDPLAAALAMLPTAMQQAMVSPPVAAGEGDAAPQPTPSISPAALAQTSPANSDSDDKVTTTDAAEAPSTPLVLSEVEGRDLGAAPMARASTALGTNGSGGASVAGDAAEARTPSPAPAPIGDQNAVRPDIVGTHGALLAARTDAPRTGEAPSRPAKRKTDDAATALIGGTDLASTASAATPQATASTTDATTATAKPGDPQTPIAQALANQHLKISSDGQWLDQLARDIAKTASGDGKLSFHLNPEHLGSLQVEVTRGPEGASVRLTADTDAARTILIDAQPRLQAEARAQGVKIAETHVDLGGHNAQGQGTRQQAQAPPDPLVRAIGAGEVAGAARATNIRAAAAAAAERFA